MLYSPSWPWRLCASPWALHSDLLWLLSNNCSLVHQCNLLTQRVLVMGYATRILSLTKINLTLHWFSSSKLVHSSCRPLTKLRYWPGRSLLVKIYSHRPPCFQQSPEERRMLNENKTILLDVNNTESILQVTKIKIKIYRSSNLQTRHE